jgi:dephospho-CoA kinase
VQRLAASGTLDGEQIAAARRDAATRLAAQIPDREKEPLCDHVLENSGTLEELRERVHAIFRELSAEAADKPSR